MTHEHAEAFMLMKYRADDGSEEEIIWNSRDGVTPFVVALRSGKEAQHVEWAQDVYAPEFIPPVGSRVFIDCDEARHHAGAVERVEAWWNHPSYPMSEAYASKAEAIAALSGDFRPGEPALIEVREPWTGGVLVEQGAEEATP